MLEQKTDYVTTYTPSLLNSIERQKQRSALGIVDTLPFRGMDFWNAYEFSYLNSKGKPEVAVLQVQIPCTSANIPESKSLKLYLGSFSQTRFGSRAEVASTLESDLNLAVHGSVNVMLSTQENILHASLGVLSGQNLDLLDIDVSEYFWNPDFLEVESDLIVRESVYSNLLSSRCPVTGQPDHASITIQYSGRNINKEGLLRYLVSYREHAEYVEQIVERIYMDIMNRCEPDRLSVYANYTRRGGIDINPFRSHDEEFPPNIRTWRQ